MVEEIMLRIPRKKIACKPLFDPDMTSSGLLYIPDTAKERCDQGIVKYVGDECRLVKPGDHVLFSGYTGTLMSLEDEGLIIILPEEFVVAVIEERSEDHDVPGLYFRDTDGVYWTATYEMTIDLLARAINESDWFRKLNKHALERGKKGWVTSEKPKPDEVTWR
jgi:chaperonin GroES